MTDQSPISPSDPPVVAVVVVKDERTRFGLTFDRQSQSEMVMHRGPKRSAGAVNMLHLAEAFAQTQAVLNTAMGTTVEIQTGVDPGRSGIWRAWIGGEGFDRAKFKGEWGNELGALRMLRNSALQRAQQHETIKQDSRPVPGGGSASMLDILDQRRKPQVRSIAALPIALFALLVVIFGGFVVRVLELLPRPTVSVMALPVVPPPRVTPSSESSDPVTEEELYPPARIIPPPRRSVIDDSPPREPSRGHSRSHDPPL